MVSSPEGDSACFVRSIFPAFGLCLHHEAVRLRHPRIFARYSQKVSLHFRAGAPSLDIAAAADAVLCFRCLNIRCYGNQQVVESHFFPGLCGLPDAKKVTQGPTDYAWACKEVNR